MPETWGSGVLAATAGTVAAAIWAGQQPLDKRLLGSTYDDVEMMGKLITWGPWRITGWALHLIAGAAFGMLYARYVRPRSPAGPVVSGMATAVAETLLLWPLAPLHDRLHPAREELPVLSGNRRAFAQAIWRHALYGGVLGAIVG